MDKLKDQAGYWDKAAKEKEFTHPLDIDKLSALIPLGSRILDVGCGYGRISAALHNFGFEVCGVDSSEKMIERGVKQSPHLNLLKNDGESLPFEGESFDAVILFAVLTCIPQDLAQANLVREIQRVLKPEGIVYVSDYWLQSDTRNKERYDKNFKKYGIYGVFELEKDTILRHHDKEWLNSLFKIFTKVELRDIDVKTMNGNPAKAFQYFGQNVDHGSSS